MSSMKKLSVQERCRILSCLVEGCSVRSTCRMTGFAKGTVLKFMAELGAVCEEYHDAKVRGLKSARIQCDEIWAFCGSKAKNVPPGKNSDPNYGDVWTWTALDADSKFMVTWLVGSRDAGCAHDFIDDLKDRLAGRVQLTTDGYKPYEFAVQDAFGWQIDYAQLIKIYGEPRDGHARYSPAECTGTRIVRHSGRPDTKHISTSHVERQNLTIRMGLRRFTRLTNAFSKKFDNHRAAVAIHFMHYNFCRVHMSLRVTPAMEVGIATHVWELSELVALLVVKEASVIGTEANKRGPYRRRGVQSEH